MVGTRGVKQPDMFSLSTDGPSALHVVQEHPQSLHGKNIRRLQHHGHPVVAVFDGLLDMEFVT